HGKVKSTKSDRVYLVLEGKGKFMVGNEKNDVKKDDVIIIPKNTPYDYKAIGGKLKLFLVHTPAYDEKAEIKLEK
ncbi:MAG: cupin domain-containing protein, partial [candidate division Zixibacteria bacterium]|nr:cupin domain-containing protein [candidate division Zixibacteria bacterium]